MSDCIVLGLQLDAECESCHGKGYRRKMRDDGKCTEKIGCRSCDGKGKLLTPAGRALLAFIREYNIEVK